MLPDKNDQPTPRSPEWLAGWDAGREVGWVMGRQIDALRAERDALASVVTTQRSQLDTLRAAADEAARAQMERDCAVVCGGCRKGEELQHDGEWHHLFRGHLRNVCHAGEIRAAFAALHPEPANG